MGKPGIGVPICAVMLSGKALPCYPPGRDRRYPPGLDRRYPPGFDRRDPAVPRSPGRPGHGPAAEDMSVHVPDCLPCLGAGVEHDAVSGTGDPLGFRDLMRLGGQLVHQAIPGLGGLAQIPVVVLGDHEYMAGRLGIDVSERERARTLEHSRRWNLTRHNLTEKAVTHGRDLNVRRMARYCFLSVAPAAPASHAPARRTRTAPGASCLRVCLALWVGVAAEADSPGVGSVSWGSARRDDPGGGNLCHRVNLMQTHGVQHM